MTGLAECCLRGFEWDGTPTGKESEVAGIKTYVTGSSSSNALLYIHDAFGWTFTNARLLADHYAREAGVTVYVADFFGGEVLPIDLLLQGQLDKVDIPSFLARNSRAKREPEIVRFAQALRERYSFLGAIGFCYGGWAVFRLASGETPGAAGGKPLIDCGIVGHPSLVEKPDVDGIRVPMQVLSPELDDLFDEELKLYTWQKLQENKVGFDWQFFPGMIHGALTRGDERVEGEREAMVKGKNAAVWWLKLHTAAKGA